MAGTLRRMNRGDGTGTPDVSRPRRLAALGLIAGGLLGCGDALAECTPWSAWECDFEHEDTQLWLQQPAYKFISDDDVDTLVSDAWTAVHGYRASVKTLGDGAIRDSIERMIERLDETMARVVAELAKTAANDPRHLKPLYTDRRCALFWAVVDPERTCATTPGLVLDTVRLAKLAEVRAAVAALAVEPFAVLGEEWGDIGDEVRRIREAFGRADPDGGRTLALGGHLAPDALRAEIEARFRGFEDLLDAPAVMEAEWIRTRSEIGATLRDTMIGSARARREIGDVQLGADRAELAGITDRGRNAVGRMQVMELADMTGMQSVQAWLKIREQTLQDGNLAGLDMATELEDDARRKAAGFRVRRQLEGVGTVLGNGVGAVLP